MNAPDSPPPPTSIPASIPWDQRLARLCVRPFVRSPVTPNQITALSLLVGLAAAWLYARGGAAVHWGAALFVLAAWLDHADGELARLSGRTSSFGHYFDIVAGGIVTVLVFVGMGWGLRQTGISGWAGVPWISGTWIPEAWIPEPWIPEAWIPGAWTPALGIAAGGAIAVIYTVRLGMEGRVGKAAVAQPSFLGFEIEDLLYLVAPITWLGWHGPFLLLAGIGAPLFLVWQLWTFGRARP